VSLKPEAGAPL